ncbi:MAG: outer membrane beta-barrel protein [Pseudobdellovibrionaceae bacterium]|nr:outer membrane beta-barrel protein [Pseudobdellovibrionaceae bacterium]
MARINMLLTALGMLSSVAFADGLTVKPEIIGSQSKFDFDKIESVNLTTGRRYTSKPQGKSETISGLGGGVAIEFGLNDLVSIGGGVSYLNYPEKDDNAEFGDLNAKGYATYSFYKQAGFDAYGLGGLSIHQLSVDDSSEKLSATESVSNEADPVTLANYDLGVGTNYKVSDSVAIGLKYSFSDSFWSQDLKSQSTSRLDEGTEVDKATTKGLSMQSHSLTLSASLSL